MYICKHFIIIVGKLLNTYIYGMVYDSCYANNEKFINFKLQCLLSYDYSYIINTLISQLTNSDVL